jgi:hypothetical protein
MNIYRIWGQSTRDVIIEGDREELHTGILINEYTLQPTLHQTNWVMFPNFVEGNVYEEMKFTCVHKSDCFTNYQQALHTKSMLDQYHIEYLFKVVRFSIIMHRSCKSKAKKIIGRTETDYRQLDPHL